MGCDTRIKSYFNYWGKASPSTNDQTAKYHLLPYHSLDVAAVGHVLLSRQGALNRHLSELMGLSGQQTLNWITFLLGLHDLGKFAESFQQLRPDLRELFWPEAPVKKTNYSIRHDTLGHMLWRECLRKHLFKDGWNMQFGYHA